MHGAKIYEGVKVKEVINKNGVVKGVVLNDGSIVNADYVVNCTGMWARQFG